MSTRAFNRDAKPYVGLRRRCRRWVRYAWALVTAGVALLLTQSAVAFEDRFGDSPAAPLKGNVPPLPHVKGKVLDAQLKGRKYVIKLLDDSGRIRTIEVDSGAPGGGGGGTGGGGSLAGGGGPGPSSGGGGSTGGGGPGGGGGGSGRR